MGIALRVLILSVRILLEICAARPVYRKKRTEKTAPFGVNLTRSLVTYQAAQRPVYTCMASEPQSFNADVQAYAHIMGLHSQVLRAIPLFVVYLATLMHVYALARQQVRRDYEHLTLYSLHSILCAEASSLHPVYLLKKAFFKQHSEHW